MNRGVYIVLGLFVAVFAAMLIWPDEVDEFIDSAGDVLYQLTTSEEGRIAKLQPDVQEALRSLLADLAGVGIRTEVRSTLRTRAEEKAVIDAGRSAVKSYSWHEIGRAVDLYPFDPNTGTLDLNGRNIDVFRAMHDIASARGWRGIAFNSDGSKRYITNAAGKKIWDGSHLEWWGPYASKTEALAAEGPAFGIA